MLFGLDGVEIGLIIVFLCLFGAILSGFPVAFSIGGAGVISFAIIAALDSSGLLIGPTEPTPRALTIVVSNDNGGGIFELLEQGDPRFSDVSSRIFGTPHDVDVGALCRAYHVDSRQIEIGELAGALDEPQDGMRVLEVKADRSSLRALHAAIKASL